MKMFKNIQEKKFSFKNKINLIKGLNSFYYVFVLYLTVNYHFS